MATPFLRSLALVTATGTTVGAEAVLSQSQNLSVSAAGNNTVGVLTNNQSLLPKHTTFVTAATGSGAYTSIVVLSATNHLAGDEARVVITLPASANPTITVRNATASGTVLLTVANAGAGARVVSASFTFNGLAWVLSQGATVTVSSVA